jgi:hypothetical protein
MEIRVLAATGVLGAGFKVESLNRGIALKPTFIACDAGSTDSGPAYLGSGRTRFPHRSCPEAPCIGSASITWSHPITPMRCFAPSSWKCSHGNLV